MKTNMNMMKSILMVLVVGALVCSSCDDGDDANGSGTQPCNCFTAFGEYTHLDEGKSCTCGGTSCVNCTLKVNATLSNGTTKVWKEVGVSSDDFDNVVEMFNGIWNACNDTTQTKFKQNITSINVQKGDGISHQGTVLLIGHDALEDDIWEYLYDKNIINAT